MTENIIEFIKVFLVFFAILAFVAYLSVLGRKLYTSTSKPEPMPKPTPESPVTPSEPRILSRGEIKYQQLKAERLANPRLELKDAFTKLVQSFGDLSPEEKDMAYQKAKPIINVLNTVIPSTVITARNLIITYRNITFKLTPEEIQAKLTEIVEANPSVDVKKLQGPLGIQVIDVQGSGRTQIADEDIYS